MDYLQAIMAAILVSATTLVSAYAVMIIERRRGFVSPDVHKPGRPLVPKVGGLALLIAYIIIGLVTGFMGQQVRYIILPCVLSVILAGLIGLIDDLVGVGAVKKLFLFMIPGIPLVIARVYDPHPYVPFVGQLRLTLVYPLLLLILFTVMSNAFNMSDTHNGTVLIISYAMLLTLGIGALLPGPKPMRFFWLFYVLSAAALIAYTPFNMYPAKVFNGNCGSHLLGAVIASLIVLSRREFLALMALTPLVLNGFSILASIKGLRSKESIERPVVLTKDWRIKASRSKSAPITLVQLMTLNEGLTELEIVTAYAILYLLVALISLATYYALCVISSSI